MDYDVAIIGGGLSGLTAAAYLAQAGKSVLVLEKSNRLGGRAKTNNKNGALFNLGAKALYLDGEAHKIFDELGLNIPGQSPSKKIHIMFQNEIYPMPIDLPSIIPTSLLSWKGKIEYTRLMVKLMLLNPSRIPESSVREWLNNETNDEMVKVLFYGVCRLSTYIDAPDTSLARPLLLQIKRAITKGTRYVDGGWETLVQELNRKAVQSGTDIHTNSKVQSIEASDKFITITCGNNHKYKVKDCILAIPPKGTLKLVNGKDTNLLGSDTMVPITASCLDLGLRELPNPEYQTVIGTDQPLYFSNHSQAARLSENGTFVVSLLKYHLPGTKKINPDNTKRELEAYMEMLHPGWKEVLVTQRFLPKMIVSYDYPKSTEFHSNFLNIKGLHIAGDWVSHGELLADAAVASGKRAALAILQLNN